MPTALQTVTRKGKFFEAGNFPDKKFSMSEKEILDAIEHFNRSGGRVELDLEHMSTVLDGKLGQVISLTSPDNGKTLMGEAVIPKWLGDLIPKGQFKVSCTWDRVSKTLQKVAIVNVPRISDAVLMAAFNAAEGSDSDDDRHDTPEGFSVLQGIHNMAARAGAICTMPDKSKKRETPAYFVSKHESDAIQALHDRACEHGACCSSKEQGYYAYYGGKAYEGQPGDLEPLKEFFQEVAAAPKPEPEPTSQPTFNVEAMRATLAALPPEKRQELLAQMSALASGKEGDVITIAGQQVTLGPNGSLPSDFVGH